MGVRVGGYALGMLGFIGLGCRVLSCGVSELEVVEFPSRLSSLGSLGESLLGFIVFLREGVPKKSLLLAKLPEGSLGTYPPMKSPPL